MILKMNSKAWMLGLSFLLSTITGKTALASLPLPNYEISPNKTFSGKSFSLDLLSYQFNCGTTYSHLSTTVNGNEIGLTFLPIENPAAICPAVFEPYGPSFQLSALKPGKYAIYASKLAPCMVQVPSVCKMALPIEFVDTLIVEDIDNRIGWYASPNIVAANQAFTFQLLNNDYGNCFHSFSNSNLVVYDSVIYVDFTIEEHPERLCFADIHPHGPTFSVNGLKAGTYPINMNVTPKCPPGMGCIAVIVTKTVDTLFVLKTLGITTPYHKNEKDLQINTQDNQLVLSFSLNVTRTVTAEIYSLNGERIETFPSTVLAKGNNHMNLSLGKNRKQGVYLLKLNVQGSQPLLKTFHWAQ